MPKKLPSSAGHKHRITLYCNNISPYRDLRRGLKHPLPGRTAGGSSFTSTCLVDKFDSL